MQRLCADLSAPGVAASVIHLRLAFYADCDSSAVVMLVVLLAEAQRNLEKHETGLVTCFGMPADSNRTASWA